MSENLQGAGVLLVAAVIIHDVERNKVLLLQRGPNAKFAQGMWDLPVGKNSPGESVSETAVRELREETELIVEPDALELAGVIHCAKGVEAPNGFLTVVFVAKKWFGQPVNAEPAKHAQVRWFDAGSIPAEFVPTTAEALAGYLANGVHVCLHGW